MFKKSLFCLIIILGMVPFCVSASDNYAAKVGDKYYTNLKDAIANASSTDVIMITSNVVLDETLLINKVVNLNLNGRSIFGDSKVFQVEGGTLNVSGAGKIAETEPNYGAIYIKGSEDPNSNLYSVVNVGKDVVLEGWSGIFITHEVLKSYGVEVNLEGTINAVKDTDGGSAAGIYVNGNIKHPENHPVINILDGASINVDGTGLYIAGFATFNIGKAKITGVEAGIGIKSGILNINGATITCTGEDTTPTEGYNNGIKSSGTTIQIESNEGYAGNIEINIKSGNFTSKHSNVIYEYIGKGTSSTVNAISILGGTFISEDDKDVFSLSNSLKNNHPNFIRGGKYSSNPSQYLKSEYTTTIDQNLFMVIKSTMKEVFFNNSQQSNNNLIKILIILFFIIIAVVITYLNRFKIFNLFRK